MWVSNRVDIKMLTIKDLDLLRRATDNVDIDSQFYIENKESLYKAREKICDMITLQKAWNRGKRIEIESDILI